MYLGHCNSEGSQQLTGKIANESERASTLIRLELVNAEADQMHYTSCNAALRYLVRWNRTNSQICVWDGVSYCWSSILTFASQVPYFGPSLGCLQPLLACCDWMPSCTDWYLDWMEWPGSDWKEGRHACALLFTQSVFCALVPVRGFDIGCALHRHGSMKRAPPTACSI